MFAFEFRGPWLPLLAGSVSASAGLASSAVAGGSAHFGGDRRQIAVTAGRLPDEDQPASAVSMSFPLV